MALLLNTSLRSINRLKQICVSQISTSVRLMFPDGVAGSGAGKGGGAGGSIREAGGAFGKMEAAREEEYFRKKQKEQLERMKSGLDSEKQRLEKLIKEHEEEIHKLQKLQKDSKK